MLDYSQLKAPRDMEALGIPEALVQDLALRRSLIEGRTSTMQLAAGLALSPQLMTGVVEEMRELRLIEILGLDGRDYQLALTDLGVERAGDRMKLCRYAGATPVNLSEYCAMILAQKAEPVINPATMREAFSDLVVNQVLLDELGPALIAEGAMFLYGPPGTGKSSIAERLIRVHNDYVLVPRAIEVDSQIIVVYDPVIHRPAPEQPHDLDPRWVLCSRPAVIAGGELRGEQLDLTFEHANGVYIAPMQMQANNGVFVIDDFGRQSELTPEALLNRWIVPLDRRVDFLSLSYGFKFQIPFDTKVVFSTNLDPASLGDEAFYRRIQNKILVHSIEDAEFDEVLRRVADAFGVVVDPEAPAYLRQVSRERGDGDLRPYLPKEVCRILSSVCAYNKTPVVLDRTNIDRVAAVYFTKPEAEAVPPRDDPTIDVAASEQEHKPAAAFDKNRALELLNRQT